MARAIWSSICFFMLAVVVSGQSPRVPPRVMPPAGMRPYLAAISVRSLDDSIAWYRDVLGFTQVERMSFADQGIAVALLEAAGFRLELVEKRGSVAAGGFVDMSNPAQMRGFGKLAFLVDDAAGLAKELKARGVEFVLELRDDPKHGQRAFIVKDNDGNWIELFEETARTNRPGVTTLPAAFEIDAPDWQFMAISVRDVDSSAAWYRRAFGFREIRRSSFAGGRAAILRAGRITLELLGALPPQVSQESSRRPGAGRWTVQGFFKAGVYITNLDALAAHLKSEGIVTDGGIRKDETDGDRRFILLSDVEGNDLQVFERTQASVGSSSAGVKR